jgi:hypothetical protein
MYNQNFVNWDFYATHYLNSFKDFRTFINRTFSKTNFLLNFNESKNKNIDAFNENVFKNEIRVCKYSDIDSSFTYIITTNTSEDETDKKIRNYLHKLRSFSIRARHEYNFKERRISFNFKHMQTIIRLSEYRDIETLLKMLLLFDKNTGSITIDYDFFNNLDESYFQFSKKMKNKSDNCLPEVGFKSLLKLEIQ